MCNDVCDVVYDGMYDIVCDGVCDDLFEVLRTDGRTLVIVDSLSPILLLVKFQFNKKTHIKGHIY